MDDTGGILKTSDLNPNILPNVAKLISEGIPPPKTSDIKKPHHFG
jgi:hypothetical protein